MCSIMAGRKLDPLWNNFVKVANDNKTGYRAICKNCNKEMQGVIQRMKKHEDICSKNSPDVETINLDDDDDQNNLQNTAASIREITSIASSREPVASTSAKSVHSSKSISLVNYVVRTTKQDKEALDELAARFFNRKVENPVFLKFCSSLRPGYVPPNSRQLANELLNKVYQNELEKVSHMFENQIVTLAIDGWSNVNNCPVVSGSITKNDGVGTLCKKTDTSGHKHDSNYLKTVAIDMTHESHTKFRCKVGAIGSDSAPNMVKMRSELNNTGFSRHSNIYMCCAYL